MAVVDGCIKCSACGEVKPVSEYQPSIVDKGCGACRPCKYQQKRAYERRNREKTNAARSRHRKANIDHHKTVAKKWRDENPEKVKSYNLKRAYGITIEQYDQMVEEQDGKCAICRSSENKDGRNLYVDHCHDTGKIRGLLCHKCNSGIGAFRDDPGLIETALTYLRG